MTEMQENTKKNIQRQSHGRDHGSNAVCSNGQLSTVRVCMFCRQLLYVYTSELTD